MKLSERVNKIFDISVSLDPSYANIDRWQQIRIVKLIEQLEQEFETEKFWFNEFNSRHPDEVTKILAKQREQILNKIEKQNGL